MPQNQSHSPATRAQYVNSTVCINRYRLIERLSSRFLSDEPLEPAPRPPLPPPLPRPPPPERLRDEEEERPSSGLSSGGPRLELLRSRDE